MKYSVVAPGWCGWLMLLRRLHFFLCRVRSGARCSDVMEVGAQREGQKRVVQIRGRLEAPHQQRPPSLPGMVQTEGSLLLMVSTLAVALGGVLMLGLGLVRALVQAVVQALALVLAPALVLVLVLVLELVLVLVLVRALAQVLTLLPTQPPRTPCGRPGRPCLPLCHPPRWGPGRSPPDRRPKRRWQRHQRALVTATGRDETAGSPGQLGCTWSEEHPPNMSLARV